MPPKARIKKEMILEAAFELTREHGFEEVNARALALKLGCSTQPIFSNYASMSDLKRDLYRFVQAHFDQLAEQRMQGEQFFHQLGLAYIDFARHERNLFKLLFMGDYLEMNSLTGMFEDSGNEQVAQALSQRMGISVEAAKDLFMKLWIFTHGIATMHAANNMSLSEAEIERLTSDAYKAFTAQTREAKQQ